MRVVGISPSPRDDQQAAEGHLALARECAEILELDLSLQAEDFESYAAFVGPDYGVVTPESCEALHLLAQQEGLLLDPSYTSQSHGRAFGACAGRLVASRAEPYLSPYRRHTRAFCLRQRLGLLTNAQSSASRWNRTTAVFGSRLVCP